MRNLGNFMLIRFIIRNFLSFRDEIEFSMIAGKPRTHPTHVIEGEGRNGIDVLKSAVIYGANASGKSNLVKAIYFAKSLVIEGTRPNLKIPLNQFRFDESTAKEDSKFEFEFEKNAKTYVYGFELNTSYIASEWLYETKKKSEKLVFERVTNLTTTGEFSTNIIFASIGSSKSRKVLELLGTSTRHNQLFATETFERENEYLKELKEIFSWFKSGLTIIFPESRHAALESYIDSNEVFRQRLAAYLNTLDTGVFGVGTELIDADKDLSDISSEDKQRLVQELSDSSERIILTNPEGGRIIVNMDEGGNLRAAKVVTKHKIKNKESTVSLGIEEESDGTQRLVDLFPAMLGLTQGQTCIVDELDRSLHPLLSQRFFELFFKMTAEAESQLIVTTHESSLLNLDLFRRDEIWFVEKDNDGCSKLYSLEEFATRYDTDIRKGYLKGRYGAIPLLRETELGWVN